MGVSTIVGVVLLTGVVVVAVTTAGAFMIQNFQQQSSVEPLTDVRFEENISYVNDGSGNFQDYPAVTLSHEDGEPIPTNELRITVDSSPAYALTGDRTGSGDAQLAGPFEDVPGTGLSGTDTFESGDNFTLYAAVDSDALPQDNPRSDGTQLSNPDSLTGPVTLVDEDGTVASGVRLSAGQTIRASVLG